MSSLLVAETFRVSLAGHELQISPLTFAQTAALESWVAKNIPSPIQAVRDDLEKIKSTLDRDRVLGILVESYEGGSWPPAYLSPMCMRPLLYTLRGKARIIQEGLRTHHPEIADSPDACWRLARDSSETEFAAFVGALHGRDPATPKSKAAPTPQAASSIGELLLAAFLRSLASSASEASESPRDSRS